MAPPTTFVDQVKDALDHLYDLSCLIEHPLATELLPVRLSVGFSRAHALRQTILDAIDELHRDLPNRAVSRPGRVYQILELRYVESLPYRQVMSELGLSQPQYHREQRRAIEALATLLWEKSSRCEPDAEQPTPLVRADSWDDDLQAVARGPETAVDLTELVRDVVGLLERVAMASGVALRSDVTGSGVFVEYNRTMLRQLLIVATSYVLHGARGGTMVVESALTETKIRFDVSYLGAFLTENLRKAPAGELWTEGERLLRVLEGDWKLAEVADEARLSITLPRQTRSLLVIDDNPDMVQMITRFVSGQGYVVTGAVSVDEGIALAQSQTPSVIILDVMMPGRDGWDALQVFKNHPATQNVPVLVCTILADSELALALGAQGFLRKPITRPRLLESLQDCLR